MPHLTSLAVLQSLSDAELVSTHDALRTTIDPRPEEYIDEINRRTAELQSRSRSRLDRTITVATCFIAVATIVNAAAAIFNTGCTVIVP